MIVYIGTGNGNDTLVHFEGGATRNLATGEPVFLNAAATVQFWVQTAAYVDVDGDTWPQPMTWVGGSEGHFVGVLRGTVQLQEDTEYRFVGTVDNGTDQHATFDEPLHARVRS